MLKIKNLQASIGSTNVLKGLDLNVKPGEVHAIMGPNGAGKSTLSNVLSGHPAYEVTSGQIEFLGNNLLETSIEERAQQGLFMGFQYPVEIPGVNNLYFMKSAYNIRQKSRGEEALDAIDFIEFVKSKLSLLEMPEKFLHRALNEGFSGGEKKKNEILQMLVLEPKLVVLDETDSGLDIDALQVIAQGVNQMRDQNRSFILVTHYQRLLNYIKPDVVHVLINGKIVKSGDYTLAQSLEEKGYGWITD